MNAFLSVAVGKNNNALAYIAVIIFAHTQKESIGLVTEAFYMKYPRGNLIHTESSEIDNNVLRDLGNLAK